MCHMHVSHKWQKRPTTVSGQALGSAAACTAPSWTHSWNTEKLAAPPKPREDTTRAFTLWFAVKNLQTQASLRNQGGSQLRNPGRLICSLPLLSQDVVRPWMFVCPPPMQQQHEESRRKRHLIASFPATETKSLNCVTRAFTTALLSGRRTADRTQPSREHCITPLTSLPVETALRCRRNHSSAGSSAPESSLDTGRVALCWYH